MLAMSDERKKSIADLFSEGTEIDKALELAVQDALWRHKQLGNPVAVWRDGKVVWIPPEEIPVQKPAS
jgi:hypothetical protein